MHISAICRTVSPVLLFLFQNTFDCVMHCFYHRLVLILPNITGFGSGTSSKESSMNTINQLEVWSFSVPHCVYYMGF